MSLSPSVEGHLTQAQLEAALWAAANALRGPVEAGDYKAYVFPVLFFKWISDSWRYERMQAVEEYGEDVDEETEADYHTFALPTGCTWEDVFNAGNQTGAKLDKALQQIEIANPDNLSGVFGDVNWANQDRLPHTALRALLSAFNAIKLDPDSVSGDMLGSAYEYLLREFAEASGKKAGEFFTPRAVVHLIVKILGPEADESIADPACGSGGMLVETVTAVKASGMNPDKLKLYGQEINPTTSAIAKMNLFLHGLEDFHIARGDTFGSPKLLDGEGLKKFDVVIANPPFSLQNWGASSWSTDPYERSKYGVPPAKNGDWAWIEHMITSMKEDTGRVGVVMPHGTLFRGGAEARIREAVLRDNVLEAVIGLPNNLFYSTSIPVAILVFRKNKPLARLGKVLFIDASERFVAGKNQNTMSDEDIEVIDTAYKNGFDADGDEGLKLRLVDIEEIAENGYDLNIGRYIKNETAVEANVEEAIIAYKESAERLAVAEENLALKLKAAGYDF